MATIITNLFCRGGFGTGNAVFTSGIALLGLAEWEPAVKNYKTDSPGLHKLTNNQQNVQAAA